MLFYIGSMPIRKVEKKAWSDIETQTDNTRSGR